MGRAGATMFAARIYQRGIERLVAAADEELLGTHHAEGKFRLDVAASFYDGMRIETEALEGYLLGATVANLVGERAVAVAIRIGLVDAKNVLRVEGIPHAQFLVIEPES
jgi:uncharacterized protein